MSDLRIATHETGCRPQESLRIEVRHVDLANQRWVLPSRFGEWSGGVDRLDLQVLTPEASIEFLEQRTAGGRRIAADDESAVAALARD